MRSSIGSGRLLERLGERRLPVRIQGLDVEVPAQVMKAELRRLIVTQWLGQLPEFSYRRLWLLCLVPPGHQAVAVNCRK